MQKHITVLLNEATASLELKKDSVIVDATYGSGGHADLILSQLGKKGTYIGIDIDETAFINQPTNAHGATVHLVNDNFRNISNIISSLHITEVDGVLADLGWRMEQFSESGKGLSFMHDEPLLMTYGASEKYSFTAYDIVNEWDEEVLADIIFGYGEERFARRIARGIIARREDGPIVSTFELRDCIIRSMPGKARFGKTNPATKTFQALRIAVNEELQILDSFLKDAFQALKPGGKLAIITFHSLEDRIVKHYFRSLVSAGVASLVNKKPITAAEDELTSNPRSRSAKLRVLTKDNNVEYYEKDNNFSKRL